MADYSEFPTTPTAWQDQQALDWQTVSPLETEDTAPPRRTLDRVALVPGVFFVVLAVALMSGWALPQAIFHDGGLFWFVVVGAGIALLVGELRKARRRR